MAPRALPALALLVVPVLAGCLAAPQAPGATPDLVLAGGAVWVGDAAGTVAEALAVRGGRIVAVGSDAEVRALAGPSTRVVELRGGLALPGFRDHHAHVLEVAADNDPDEANPFAPVLAPHDPVRAEVGRQQVAAYHLATKAQGRSPTDGCTRGEAGPELERRLRFGLEQAARQGLVAVTEAGLEDLAILDALRTMERAGPLPARVLILLNWGCLEDAAAAGLLQVDGAWVRVAGVKLYGDGWLGSRTAALREPYADRPVSDGVLFLEPPRARADVARARALGAPVMAHAIGDRAAATLLDAFEAAGAGPADRWSLEHVQVMGEDLVERMAALGVVGGMQLSFATSDHRFAEDALGPERLAWAYAWRSMLDRGVRLAGSSDFPIEALNPLWGVQRTVTRQELDGTPPGGWRPEEALTLAQALALVTSGAAYASFEDAERGTLEVGKVADLVVLEENILALPAGRIASATVRLTVANGIATFEGAQAYPPQGDGALNGRRAWRGDAAPRGDQPKLLPQPQDELALGFLMLNPPPIRESM